MTEAAASDVPVTDKSRRKSRSSSKRSANSRSSYERIQVAALNLFAEVGVESTSIRDIGARNAGSAARRSRNRQFATVIDDGWRPLPKKEKDNMLKVRDACNELWDEMLREGNEAQVFDTKEPRLARLGIVQMCCVSTWYSPGGSLTVEGITQHFGELVAGFVRAARNGKTLRFPQVKKPDYEAVLEIVERHHRGPVFAGKI
ncbi:MAG: hypothetical protein ABIT61_03805 [Steroidobacteraceae bacterium]